MKSLKFLILPLFLIGIFGVSCSSDDDSGQGENVDLIVGTWKITDVWMGGQSVYALIQMTNPCPLQTKFIFENDFSVRVETFVAADSGDGCVPDEVQNGNWSKEGSTYYVSSEGQTAHSEVEFLDNNNFTLMIEFEGESAKVKLTRQ
ncbi:MAG: lipocalin family protein [Flavobacteriia bacterium]|nr:lipocalin family protein [Flavobacteriia bacterium]